MDDQKEAERRAHVQRRAEEASRAGRGHVDAYRKNVVRGSTEAGGAEQLSVRPPTLPADFGGMHVFYSAEAPGALLDKITAALTSMKDSPVVVPKQKAAKVGVMVLMRGWLLLCSHNSFTLGLPYCDTMLNRGGDVACLSCALSGSLSQSVDIRFLVVSYRLICDSLQTRVTFTRLSLTSTA